MSTFLANTGRRQQKEGTSVSCRLYGLLLRAYPAEFRHAYGQEMAQVFRDCYRAEKRHGGQVGIILLWLRTLLDFFQTATKEHLENVGKENSVMKNPRRDAVAFLGCIGIILSAFLLLTFGQRNAVPFILVLGYALDAVVVAGIVGNLIVFLLAKTTQLNTLRTAFWTFLVVNATPVLLLALISGGADPRFNLGSVAVGYVVSFIFWFGLHWIWAQTKPSAQPAM